MSIIYNFEVMYQYVNECPVQYYRQLTYYVKKVNAQKKKRKENENEF